MSIMNLIQINNPNTFDSGFKLLLIITIVGIGGIMILFTKLYLDNKK